MNTKKINASLLINENNKLIKGSEKDFSKLKWNLKDLEKSVFNAQDDLKNVFFVFSSSLINQEQQIENWNSYNDKLKNKILVIEEININKTKYKKLIDLFDFVISIKTDILKFVNFAQEKYYFNSQKILYHGAFLVIFGEGVIIKGEPGIGKSELAISLINQKHLFIADDSIVIFSNGTNIYGKSSHVTKDYLEVRGIGLVNIEKVYGTQYITHFNKINYIINLVKTNSASNESRLISNYSYETIMGKKIKKINIYTAPGRNLTDLVELAISNEKLLKHKNYNAFEEFKKVIKK